MKCQTMPVSTLYTMGQNPSGSRIVLIDFLRGLWLLVMTVDHLPETLIKNYLAGLRVFLGGPIAYGLDRPRARAAYQFVIEPSGRK
jgi:uncharacterized membrane protein